MNLKEAAQQATPREQLLKELMDSRVPKTEREHAAAREIERLRAAGQQTLEAMELHLQWHESGCVYLEPAVTSLRAALAEYAMQRLADVQQEMESTIKDNLTVEPVAWISEVVCVGPNLGVKRYDKLPIQSLQPGFYKHTPLYTAPPKREPLTDDEIRRIDDATPFHEDVEWEVRFAPAQSNERMALEVRNETQKP